MNLLVFVLLVAASMQSALALQCNTQQSFETTMNVAFHANLRGYATGCSSDITFQKVTNPLYHTPNATYHVGEFDVSPKGDFTYLHVADGSTWGGGDDAFTFTASCTNPQSICRATAHLHITPSTGGNPSLGTIWYLRGNDGINAPVSFASSPSVAFWIRLQRHQVNSDVVLLSRFNTDMGRRSGFQVSWSDANDRVEVTVLNQGTNVNPRRGDFGLITIHDGKWHMIAVVADEQKGDLTIYVDGIPVYMYHDVSTLHAIASSAGVPLLLGCDSARSHCMAGNVQGVMWWDRVVPVDTIRYVFNYRPVPSHPNQDPGNVTVGLRGPFYGDLGRVTSWEYVAFPDKDTTSNSNGDLYVMRDVKGLDVCKSWCSNSGVCTGFDSRQKPGTLYDCWFSSGDWRNHPLTNFPGNIFYGKDHAVVEDPPELSPEDVKLVSTDDGTSREWPEYHSVKFGLSDSLNNANMDRCLIVKDGVQSRFALRYASFPAVNGGDWEIALSYYLDVGASSSPPKHLSVVSRLDPSIVYFETFFASTGSQSTNPSHPAVLRFVFNGGSSLDATVLVDGPIGCLNSTVVARVLPPVTLYVGGDLFANVSANVLGLSGIGAEDLWRLIPANQPTCDQAPGNMGMLGTFSDVNTGVVELIFPPMPAGKYVLCVYPFLTLTRRSRDVLVIHDVASGSTPLASGWVRYLLHLGTHAMTHIENGQFDKQYFPQGDSTLTPRQGDVLDASAGLIWTPLYQADGLWAHDANENMNGVLYNNFVDYFALAVFSPIQQSISLVLRHDDELAVWMDGMRVYYLRSWDLGRTRQSSPVKIQAGWHQFVFKLHEGGGGNYFAVQIVGTGLSWSYELPLLQSSCEVSPDTPRKLCGDTVISSQSECLSQGCCFDVTASPQCYLSTEGRLSYRSDLKCGTDYPSASQHYSTCNPWNTGHTCCGTNQTCGSDCFCPGCVDYRPVQRSSYEAECLSCTCGNEAAVGTPGGMSLAECQRECDTHHLCSGILFDDMKRCVLTLGNCGVPNLVSTNVQRMFYRRHRHGHMTLACSSCRPNYLVPSSISFVVSINECQLLCTQSNGCTAVVIQGLGSVSRFANCTLYYATEVYAKTAGGNALFTQNIFGSDTYFFIGDGQDTPRVTDTGKVIKLKSYIASHPNFTYIGCYVDQSDRDMASMSTPFTYADPSLTPEKCYRYCQERGALFFGVQWSTQCFCGASYGHYGQDTSGRTCNMPCAGDHDIHCGGSYHNSVYLINLTMDGCPSGFYRIHNKCYRVYHDSLPWANASDVCTRNYGTLMSLHSAQDTVLGLSLLTYTNEKEKSFWSGGTDASHEGIWRWTDGSSFDFRSWGPGEPNNGGPTHEAENCMQIQSPTHGVTPNGLWNDLFCRVPLPFICTSDLVTLMPAMNEEIHYITAQEELVCTSKGKTTFTQNDLQLWFTFDEPDSSSHRIIKDYSSNSYDGSSTTSLDTKAFGVHGHALRLDDTTTVTIGRVPSSAMFTIAMWVMPSGAQSVIPLYVNRRINPGTSSTTSTTTFLSIVLRGTTIAVRMGPVSLQRQIPQDTFTHIAVVSDGASLVLCVNGDGVQTVRYNIMDDTADHTVTFGGRLDSMVPTGSVLVDDFRLYNSSITHERLRTLVYCSRTTENEIINVYVGEQPSWRVYGVALSTTIKMQLRPSCGTIDYGTDGMYRPINLQSMVMSSSGSLSIGARYTGMPVNLAVCFNRGLDSPFMVDTGIRMNVFEYLSLNVTNISSGVETPIMLTGHNLVTDMVAGVSAHASCAHVTDFFPIRVVDGSDNTKATLTMKLASSADVMYVCARHAVMRPIINPDSPWIPTGLRLQVAHHTWELVADVDGSLVMNSQAWAPYCAAFNGLGDMFVMKVVMGSYTDYFIPKKGATLCTVLQSANPVANFRWSAVDPTNTSVLSYSSHAAGPSGTFGGSRENQYSSYDGRRYVSFWGSHVNRGGCCAISRNTRDVVEWGRSFSVYVRSTKKNQFLVNVDIPRIIYSKTTFSFHLTVTDIQLNPIKLSSSDVLIAWQSLSSYEMTVSFSQNEDKLVATVSHNALAGSNLTLLIATNSGLRYSTFINVLNIPDGCHVLKSGSVVTDLLHFGMNNEDHIGCNLNKDCINVDMFAQNFGEANLKPNEGDKVDGIAGASASPMVWSAQHVADGRFGTGNFDHAIQYYTLAVFTPVHLSGIVMRMSFDDALRVWIDGGLVFSSDKAQNNVVEALSVSLEEGWHEFVFKLYENEGVSVLQVNVFAASLLWRLSPPPSIPLDAVALPQNTWLTQLLHLGSNFDDGFSGDTTQDFLHGEASARPRSGDMVSGYVWTPMTASDGWWANTATLDHFVQYMALAVYSPSTQTVPVSFRYDDHLTAWLDGVVFAQYRFADHGQEKETRVLLSRGWHQMLFKIADVTELNYFRVKMGNSEENTQLAWQYELPQEASTDGFLATNGYVTRLLHLGSQLTDRLGNNTNLQKDLGDLGRTAIMAGDMIGDMKWYAVSSHVPGSWATESLGGNFYQAYAFAVYSYTNQTISATVRHNRDVFGWLDGDVVIQRNGWDNNHEKQVPPFNIAAGWHQLLFVLYAPDDVAWYPTPPTYRVVISNNASTNTPTTNTNNGATGTSGDVVDDVCNVHGRVTCSVEAYCPCLSEGHCPQQRSPRSDVPSYSGAWSPVRRVGGVYDYIRIRDGTNGPVCSLFSQQQPQQQQPLQSSDVTSVACCDFPETKAAFGVALHGSGLRYAYQIPQLTIDAPVMRVVSIRDDLVTLTLTCTTDGARILYTLDGSDPLTHGTQYSGPTLTLDSGSNTVLVLKLIAVVQGAGHSTVSEYTVDVPRPVTLIRNTLVAHHNGVLAISGGITDVQAVLLVPEDAPSVIPLTSARQMDHNGTVSGLSEPTRDGYVIIPPLCPGRYRAVYYSYSGEQRNVNRDVVTVQAMNVSTRFAVVGQEATIHFSGGAEGGDVVQWDTTNATLCTDDYCRMRLPRSYVRVNSFGSESAVGRTFPTAETYGCMCWASVDDPSMIGVTASAFTEFPITVLGAGIPTPPPTPAPPPKPTITNVIPPYAVTGDTITVFGTNLIESSSNPMNTQITLYGGVGPTPLCGITTTTSTSTGSSSNGNNRNSTQSSSLGGMITCRLVSEAGVSGQWYVAVRVGANVVTYPANMIVLPPTPVITEVRGTIRTGETIELSGSNFDTVTKDNNEVVFRGVDGSTLALTCAVTVVTRTSVQCDVRGEPLAKGTEVRIGFHLRHDVTNYTSFMVAQPIPYDGVVSVAFATSDAPGQGNRPPPPPRMSKGALIGLIVSGVLLVLIVVAGVRYIRKNFNVVLYRKPPSPTHESIEMDDADEIHVEHSSP
eukprot:PhF_6_TR38654/c0_g1_i2/m.57741